MPTRHSHLYERLNEESLYRGYLRSREGKRRFPSTLAFERDLGANIAHLAQELNNGSYQISPYRRFQVHEPKTRDICAPAFRDRVVQHAIYEMVYPIFDRTFIHDSYGCRIGKGTHKASLQAQHFLRGSRPDSYTLQLDIKKYYYNIDRAILRTLIEKKIKDTPFIDLMLSFAEMDEPVGLPIGNLLSQLFALIYLDHFDQYVKRELKVKRYVRYVDDSILFDLDRNQAYELRHQLEEWIDAQLRLKLSRFTIAPVKRGVNFVGFRTWTRYRLVRKHSLYHFNRSLANEDALSLNAIMGNAKGTSSLSHMQNRVWGENPYLLSKLTHWL